MTYNTSGVITEVVPMLAEGYNPGESVSLSIKSHIKATRSWYDGSLLAVSYNIFHSDGSPILLDYYHYINFEWVWVTSKETDDEFTLSIGTMPNAGIAGYVDLWGLVDNVDSKIATKDFYVPLKGEPPPPPEGAKVPWKWIAVGAGCIIALTLVASAAKGKR